MSADLVVDAAQQTASEITGKLGPGIGVAGSGISGCGPAIGLAADITNRESVRSLLRQAVLAYGGLDALVVTAGIFIPPDASGHIPDEKFQFTLTVNVTGSYIVADEAGKLLREQNLRSSIVLTSSANAVVPKKGSFAYDVSKTAVNHLVRELAIEFSPMVRVNCVAPATVVQGSTMFPRDRVISSLTKYQVPFSDEESTDALVSKLSRFYADRSLLKDPITPADQAEAYFLLLSDRLSKTTGQVIANLRSGRFHFRRTETIFFLKHPVKRGGSTHFVRPDHRKKFCIGADHFAIELLVDHMKALAGQHRGI